MKDKKHTHGYNIPEDYFDQFEDRLFTELDSYELPKETGFKVQETYFDTLDDKILNKIDSTISEETKIISIKRTRVYWYAISVAASIALIFSIINWNQGSEDFETVDVVTIESYLDNGALELDSYDLAEYLDESAIDNLLHQNDYVSEETIKNYLLEIMDDTSILTE